MAVDLDAGTAGVITFRSGEQFWCPLVKQDTYDPDVWLVRYESGWYAGFARDGTQRVAGVIQHTDGSAEEIVNHERDIVAFTPGPRPTGMPTALCP